MTRDIRGWIAKSGFQILYHCNDPLPSWALGLKNLCNNIIFDQLHQIDFAHLADEFVILINLYQYVYVYNS